MKNKDYLILTKGRAACLMLNSVIGHLKEMSFETDTYECVRIECISELYRMLIQVATITCGHDEWAEVYAFLTSIDVCIPERLAFEMGYMESISEKLPSEIVHN